MAVCVVPFYNISCPVGKGVGGFSTDVMLVQYMLWISLIQTYPNYRRGRLSSTLPGEAGIDIGPQAIYPHNGIYHPELDLWISFFQLVVNVKSGWPPLVQDGRVDPAPVGWGHRSKGESNKWTTIQAMNYSLYTQCNGRYQDIPSLSCFPKPLAAELEMISIGGMPDGKSYM